MVLGDDPTLGYGHVISIKLNVVLLRAQKHIYRPAAIRRPCAPNVFTTLRGHSAGISQRDGMPNLRIIFATYELVPAVPSST